MTTPWPWLIAGIAVGALVAAILLRRRTRVREASVFAGREREPLALGNADLEAFEVLVHDLNEIWRAQDVGALDHIATGDMAARLSARLQAQLAHDKGWAIQDLSLLRREVVQAWQEGGCDHAQMNLRISTIEASDPAAPRRFVSSEIWSFEREAEGKWRIAGVRGLD